MNWPPFAIQRKSNDKSNLVKYIEGTKINIYFWKNRQLDDGQTIIIIYYSQDVTATDLCSDLLRYFVRKTKTNIPNGNIIAA